MPMSPRLLRPRQTGFNPRSIPGLKIWYDVASTASMTFNGSTVSQINDLSGNGFHATQGTANNQPTYSSTSLNSRPGLTHDGTDTLMSAATVADIVGDRSGSPTITVFFVTSSSAGGAGLTVGCDPPANGRLSAHLPFDNNATNAYWDVAGTAGGRLAFSISTANRAAGVYTLQRNGANMLVRRNAAELASKSNASQTFSTASSTFGIGQITTTGFAGVWSQCLVYNTALSTANVAAVERFLARLAGVTL